MAYQRLIERTTYRNDGNETTPFGTLEAADRAEAIRLLESLAEADVHSFPTTAGHRRYSEWYRGSFWVVESCRVHVDFGRCYTEWRYRLRRPRWPATAEDPAAPAA